MKNETIYRNETITIEVKDDCMGGLLIRPVNDDFAAAYARHVEEFTGVYEESAYVDSNDFESFTDRYLGKEEIESLKNGYKIDVEIDPWELGHYYGYDANNVDLSEIEKEENNE